MQARPEVQHAEPADRRSPERAPTPAARPDLSIRALQRAVGNRAVGRLARALGDRSLARLALSPSPLPLLRAATSEAARPLEQDVRAPLERLLGRRLDAVRVHEGPASEAAAAALGARAYAIGTDVHLGRPMRTAPASERRRVLAHEAVHTVQQGSRAVVLRDSLRVAAPDEPAEREAASIAHAAVSPGLGLRGRLRVSSVEPAIQRDLIGGYDVTEGRFSLDLKTESHAGAKSGMSGTIKFHAGAAAPDSTRIRLFQAARTEDLTTGADYQWTGADAAYNAMETKTPVLPAGFAGPPSPIEAGWSIDHPASAAAKRTAAADPAVSPYYRDYWPNAGDSQDGSKQGNVVSDASLWDYPGWQRNMRYSFETVAKAIDTGHVYGTVTWGFAISNAAAGTVTGERAAGHNTMSPTAIQAERNFNEYYRNPGASTAPH